MKNLSNLKVCGFALVNPGYSPRHAKAIVILLRSKAYVVKKIPDMKVPEGEFCPGQVSWSKHQGPVNAWNVAKTKAMFDRLI